VTVISPQTYFTFTPLLPSACVGTVESRSLVEPLRKIVARVRGHFLLGSAVDIDMGERLLEVEVPHDQGEGTTRCYVPCKLEVFQACRLTADLQMTSS
jgi:NADH dehydrogenase